jgi:hypothetical protein
MVKNLTLGEEYLADHFPTFPVMPGVLILQTLVEGSAWLLRATEDFQHSVIALRDARNVKYGNFMQPGHSMIGDRGVRQYAAGNPSATFKGWGRDGRDFHGGRQVHGNALQLARPESCPEGGRRPHHRGIAAAITASCGANSIKAASGVAGKPTCV